MICSQNTTKIWEVYTRSENSFSVVSIVQENDKEFIFLSYDELGRKDSMLLITKESINQMLSDTEYLRKMSVFIEFWEKHCDLAIFNSSLLFTNKKSYLEQSLEYAFENKNIVSIQITNSDNIETGLISKISPETILLNCISLESALPYESIELNIKNIWFVEFDSCHNKVLTYTFRCLSNLQK